MRGAGDVGGGRLRLRARRDRLIQFPFLHCGGWPMAFEYAQISGPKRRAKVLLRTRNLKMARNAHAYVRGSTVKFYEWLTPTATSTFKFAISIRPSLEIPCTTSCGWRCPW